ncbi:MAG TPA: putative zinc-binding metallopeptidase [Candidatus Methylomirabilis sp.]|nr:putative zinc-binding metallopeptidase [Candidatus Methylomirabilis sp.]
MARPPLRRLGPDELAALGDEELLDVQFRELDLKIEGTDLAMRVDQLNGELASRGITFRPHFWLSDEWFCPDGVPGIAIPFYLAHPRLARLELHQVLEVEGGTPESCMQILRHETGHAVENAYLLRRRRRRQEVFGRSSQRYPEYYTPRPYSKSFVLHLDTWYAQSHPDEDFAETFAVWLTPNSMWRERYADWPALRKLECVDALMREIAGRAPVVRSQARVDPLPRLRKTLREHYKEKREHYGLAYPNFYDRDLRRLFSDAPAARSGVAAAAFLRRIRKEVRRKVASWTGEYQYTIDRVLEDIIARCGELDLRLAGPEEQAKLDFTILLTVQTMNYLHSGRHRVVL